MSGSDRLIESLIEAASKLLKKHKPEVSLGYIVDAVGELIGCADVGIWQLDNATQELELSASSGGWVSQERLPVGHGLVGAVISSQKPVAVTDVQKGFGDNLPAQGNYQAAVGFPLMWQGELYGVLVAMDNRAGHTFAGRDIQLIALFAQQASAVLATDRLVAQVGRLQRSLVDEQERLLHIQVAIRQMLDQPDMRANLAEVTEAVQALGWRRVVLVLYSRDMTVERFFSAGLSPQEDQALRQGPVVPPEVWQRFVDGELEAYRLNGLYYVPQSSASTTWHPGGLLFAPLQLGRGRVVGVIRVDDPVDVSLPTAESLRPLDILASQAAYVVENALLLEEASRSAEALAEQVDELSMIHRADRELSAHLNMDRVMTLTMDWALRRTGADTGLLALVTPDGRGLVPFITMGYLDRKILDCTEQNPWPLDVGIMGLAVRTGEIQLIDNVSIEDGGAEIMPGARSKVAVPLSMRGEVLGVITLASSEKGAFDRQNASFLERLARRAAVALDNARLFRQSEQLADDMAVLYSASRAITSTLERDEVLQRIAQSMAVALECSSAVIFGYREETREAQVLAAYKVGTIRDAHESLPEVKSAIMLDDYPSVREAVQHHHSLALRVVDPDISEPARIFMLERDIHAAMLTPLVAQEELIGMAMAIEGRRDRVFTTEEMFKAETLASQASVALRQSLLYSEVLDLEKVKSEMIRMASHDLRNPLNNIMGYVELLAMSMDQFGITPDQNEYIASLRRSAKTMQSLIDDLLTLERVESERESEWQVFDLGGLVYEVVEAERSSATLKRQELVLERPSEPSPVFGSTTQLRQAVANLVGNAIKYTPDEGRVEVTFTRQNERLSLVVKDNGYGISEERRKRIFERFYRAHEPGTDHIPGTGLGLSLVKTVIERHGGEVWFESETGKGSTFTFWVPAASDEPRAYGDQPGD
ncbi:MAG: GAF domain-containing protein [Anaerolineae bacterium]|nr:GAF domain-containing protein [Anaerolineae bacterium]